MMDSVVLKMKWKVIAFIPSQERFRYLFYFAMILSQSNCEFLSSTISHEVIVDLIDILYEQSQGKQKMRSSRCMVVVRLAQVYLVL